MMRPIDRGDPPTTFTNYSQAKPHLVVRLGKFCTYCERRIPTHLAVEHIQSQHEAPAKTLDWDNFVLSCVNCNSSKSSTSLDVGECLLPDRDNTILAISTSKKGLVEPVGGLDPVLTEKAWTLIRLVGLDKDPGNLGRLPTEADDRWLERLDVIGIASEAKASVDKHDDDEARTNAINLAKSTGFFSIWYSEFGQDPAMRQRLLEAFPGTAEDCFDDDFQPVTRPSGRI